MNWYPERREKDRHDMALAVARGLGWFSIAVGVTELLAPRKISGSLGMEAESQVVRGYGIREIATGIAILASDNPRPWIWARVAGDIMDLATLGYGMTERRARPTRIGAAMGAIAAVTVIDAVVADALGDEPRRSRWIPLPDYKSRDGFMSRDGFRRPVEAMRGVARRAFER